MDRHWLGIVVVTKFLREAKIVGPESLYVADDRDRVVLGGPHVEDGRVSQKTIAPTAFEWCLRSLIRTDSKKVSILFSIMMMWCTLCNRLSFFFLFLSVEPIANDKLNM